MKREPIVPPTDEELDYLDTVLLNRIDEDCVTEGSDEGVLCVSELDGFLTAIVSGPETVVPSRWLPAVWGDFEPVFLEREWQGKTALVVDEWCEGFLRGVELTGDSWATGGREIDELMLPILGFCEASDWAAHDLPERGATKQAQLAIAPSVRAIHGFWLERRDPRLQRVPARRSEPPTGRNDPCPCGSGKKYKHCCLI